MKILKWAIILIISAYILLFAFYNREAVSITFPITGIYVEIPVYLLFFVIIIIGIVLGGGVVIAYRIKLYNDMRKYKKREKALEKEITSLKVEKQITDSLPIN